MAITKSQVEQLYRDLLGREPDEAGVQWWIDTAANENMSLDDLKINIVGAALYNQSQGGAESQASADATLAAAKNLGIQVDDATVSAINTQTANRVQAQYYSEQSGLPYLANDGTGTGDTLVPPGADGTGLPPSANGTDGTGTVNDAIRTWLGQNPGATDAQMAAQMDAIGISPEQVAAATGMDVADIQARYQAAKSGLPYLANDGTGTGTIGAGDLSDAISGFYQSELGRDPDQAGLDWQVEQAQNLIDSGMSREDALAQIRAGINADLEGVIYDQNNPNNTGLPGVTPTQNQQDLINYADANLGGTKNLTFSEIANLDQAGNKGLSMIEGADPLTGILDNLTQYDPVTGLSATTQERYQAIRNWLGQNPGVTDAQIVAQMDAKGFTVEEVAAATGMNVADIQARYDAVSTGTGTGGTTEVDPLTGLPVTTGTGGTTEVDPVIGMPIIDGTTGNVGTGGTTGNVGTGGIIGSQPPGMLTPFQQAALAQNQAFLGTMEASAGPFGRLATTDYNRYMNPYTTGVINTTMQDLERQRQMQQNDIGYQATQAGAFGGSRHGVAEALTNEAMQRTMANTAAQQRQAGFQQAQGAAQSDIGNEMTQRQFGLNAANQMSNLAERSFNAGTSMNQMMSNVGAQQQGLQQAQIDAAKGQYGAYQGYPATGAGTFAQILGSAPYGQTSTYNPGVMDYLTVGASMIPYLPTSDIRLKKNIKKVGELANGLGVYTWEWKDKVKDLVGNFSMTKGVMAQEAMKVIPEAVKTAPNGYLAVDYSHPELSGVA